MSFHSSWAIEPPDGEPYLPIAEALARLAVAFPIHEFDPVAGREDAERRLQVLIAVKAPEAILQSYRGEPPVRVRLADALSAKYILEFDLWPDQASAINFANARHFKACHGMLTRMAEVLKYKLEEDTEAS